MEQEQIKLECEALYEVIRVARERLEEIRKDCKHPNTFDGNFSPRIGAIYPALMCSDCGHVIEITGLHPKFMQ